MGNGLASFGSACYFDNARCRQGGCIDVAAVHADDEPVPRLCRENFDRSTRDATHHVCMWGGDAVPGDAEKVRLRFYMLGAELFSLRFADS